MSAYIVTVNGTAYTVELKSRTGSTIAFEIQGESYSVNIASMARPALTRRGSSVAAPSPASPAPSTARAANAHEVRAPLPGIISDVKVAAGDAVETGSTLVVIEAMKMENAIRSHRAGKIAEVSVKKGDEVANGSLLVRFEE